MYGIYAFSRCARVCVCVYATHGIANTLAKAQFNLFSPLLPVINYISVNWSEFENFGCVRQVFLSKASKRYTYILPRKA